MTTLGGFDDPAWISAERYKVAHVFLRSRRDWSELSPLVESPMLERYERLIRN